MGKEIILKKCPICGSIPNHRADDMSGANYQHYYGCNNHIYKCPNCGVIHVSRDTVYIDSDEKADREARKAWNDECDKWEKILSWRTAISSLKEGIEPKYNLEGLVNYVTNTPPEQLDKEVLKLSKDEREELVGILLSSDYDIFNPWYKKLLISLNTLRTNDILEYYKEEFSKIK